MYKARRQASLKVRRRVGKYELGRTIGEGTFAKVRFAKDTESGDPVAIKILDKAKVHKHGLVEQVRPFSDNFLCMNALFPGYFTA